MEAVEFYLEPSNSAPDGKVTRIRDEFDYRKSSHVSSHPFSFKCELANVPNVGEAIVCGMRTLTVTGRSRQFRPGGLTWAITLNLLGEGADDLDDTDFLKAISDAWELGIDLTFDEKSGRARFTRSIVSSR